MNLTRLLLCVFLMALVSYLPRMLPIAIFRKKIENRYVRSFLNYMPYAVLGAMTIPDIFYSTESVIAAIVGCIVAFVISYFEKGLMPAALGATAAVFLVEQITKLFVK